VKQRTRSEQKALNRILHNHGIASLDNPGECMRGLATRIKDHDHFKSILARLEPELRQHCYDSIAPNIKRFTPYPLDKYIALAAMDADHQQLPAWDGDKFVAYNPFSMRTLFKRDIPLEAIARLAQAFTYFVQDFERDFPGVEPIYKVHIIKVNGVERMQFSAGVFINGEAQRIQ
jgi:hypothetical protein